MSNVFSYRSATSIEEVRNYVLGHDIVGFDIETAPNCQYRSDSKASLDPAKAHITGCSFSISEGSGIYVPIAHRIGECIAFREIMVFLYEFLTNTTITKVIHNASFESAFAYASGIVIQMPVYDTMAAAQLLKNGDNRFRELNECGLKQLAHDFFEVSLPKFEEVTAGRHFDELDGTSDEVVRYGCADADFALRLYYKCKEWFRLYIPKHQYIVENIESPNAVYMGIMKTNGIPVNIDLMQQKRAFAEQELTRLQKEIVKYTGDINIGKNCSTDDFKKFLFEEKHLPPQAMTNSRKPSLDDKALVLLKDWCKKNRPELTGLFSPVQEYRKWAKIKDTYLDGYLKYINTATGRIHPNYYSLSTDTGRMSCNNPNVQNMPRKTNDPVGIRDCVCAPEGQILLSLDCSQMELRIGAFYCRDKTMLDTYRSGGDIHAATTSVVFGISPEQAMDKNADNYKERRTIAKNVNFGVFYGLFAKGLQNTLKFKADIEVSLERCEEIISNLKNGYPGLKSWQNTAKSDAKRQGYVETWLGRRRYLPDIDSFDWKARSYAERCALNTPIQGTAADILKLSCARILSGLPSREWLKPILQIHDELVFIIPEDKLEEAVLFIKECMEAQPFPEFDLPLVVEASYGRTFGHMEDWNVSYSEPAKPSTSAADTVFLEDINPINDVTATLPIKKQKHLIAMKQEENINICSDFDHDNTITGLASPDNLPDNDIPNVNDFTDTSFDNKCTTETIPTIQSITISQNALPVKAQDVLNALYNPDENVCIRVLDDRKTGAFKGKNYTCKCCEFSSLEAVLRQHNNAYRGVYYVVNYGGHSDKDIVQIRAQFMEMDNGSFDEQLAKVNAFPCRPSMVIKTRKSLHVYWFMDKSADVSRFRAVQQALIKHFDADPACVNESRVMRLPGFNHCKKEPIEVQCIHFHPECLYSQEQLIDVLPEFENTDCADSHIIQHCGGRQKGLALAVEFCDFIQFCRDTAEHLPEPLWYAMITNLAVFEGGSDKIQELSSPYVGYSENATQNKINHYLTSGTGPITCKKIGDLGFECPRMKSGDCKGRAPASLSYRPLSQEKISEMINALPITGDHACNVETASMFVQKYLYNQKTEIALAIIDSKLKSHFNFQKDTVRNLCAAYKGEHKAFALDREAALDTSHYLKPWYTTTKEGYKFHPGILAKHLAETQDVIYTADTYYQYINGVYSAISDLQAQQIVLLKLMDEDAKMHHVNDAEMQWRLRILRDFREINPNPYVLNVKNGLYNILENKLMPHTPEYLSTIQLEMNYDLSADCPRFRQYLLESTGGDENQVLLLQEMLGYFLVPITSAQKCFVIVGAAKSGKSVLLRVLNEVLLGKQNVSNVPWQSLNERFKTAELFGKLANIFADLPTKNIDDNGIFKALVGEDFLTVEKKNKDPFSFQNTAKLLFSCNSIPKNYGDRSEGFYRRLIIIAFDHVVPEELRDPDLIDKFHQEADGILIFALEGLHRLLKNNYAFSEQEINQKMLQEYRDDSDSVRSFVRDYCDLNKNCRISSKDLYTSYQEYCADSGCNPAAINTFIHRVTTLDSNIIRGKDPTGNQRILIGIALSKEPRI